MPPSASRVVGGFLLPTLPRVVAGEAGRAALVADLVTSGTNVSGWTSPSALRPAGDCRAGLEPTADGRWLAAPPWASTYEYNDLYDHQLQPFARHGGPAVRRL